MLFAQVPKSGIHCFICCSYISAKVRAKCSVSASFRAFLNAMKGNKPKLAQSTKNEHFVSSSFASFNLALSLCLVMKQSFSIAKHFFYFIIDFLAENSSRTWN